MKQRDREPTTVSLPLDDTAAKDDGTENEGPHRRRNHMGHNQIVKRKVETCRPINRVPASVA